MVVRRSTALLVIAATSVAFGCGVALGVLGRRAVLPPATPMPRPVSADESGIPDAYLGRVAIFILAGQSNMAGTAPVEREDRTSHPRAFTFGQDYRWRRAIEPLGDAAGVGPGLAFAKELANRHPDIVVGLVPCARGGTSIRAWQRNLSDRSLYGACLVRARAASVAGDIAGVLFFQGESDVLDPRSDPTRQAPFDWAARFSQLVADLRTDLGQPGLPVVFAQIGPVDVAASPDAQVNWRALQEQQRSVNVPGVTMIKTSDLTLRDELHFTAEGYRDIGRRFAEAYLAR
jgi:hypothetical protein